MSASRCMHHALRIAATPVDSWPEQIKTIPEACSCPEYCGQPHGCRERNADYLRMQWRIKRTRQQAKAGGA
ncbi:hypothetical protein [Lysobacter olei]